ncbi:hypothetical protein HNR46_002621 [Haloferula luteola]|uniref:Lipoprotein n=1 Tax=Haloferula luteola TaxID=595692 RepID=A0A840V5R7_9BACT|nr:hypothetical protein [Haloferula luteola]MBB5352376.1 hypothetical protein [Haloferula luteola]
MKWLLLLLPSALFLASCVPATPETRIAKAPATFQALSNRHQELVREGRIEDGMSAAAVRLAWGKPSREFEGSHAGRPTQVWEYARSTPVYSTNLYGGYGYYPYGYRRYFFDLGPEISYLPSRVATVWFERGKVTQWERVR